jgi:hypothetical protein
VRNSIIAATAAATTAAVAVCLTPIAAVFAGGAGGCTVTVPEPSTMAILGAGVAGILYLHRRKARK